MSSDKRKDQLDRVMKGLWKDNVLQKEVIQEIRMLIFKDMSTNCNLKKGLFIDGRGTNWDKENKKFGYYKFLTYYSP